MNRLLTLLVLAAPTAALWPSASAPSYPAWQPLTFDKEAPAGMEPDGSSFNGQWEADGADSGTDLNNPWLHVRLTALAVPPTASGLDSYLIPGYFIGDTSETGSGNYWKIRFTPPEIIGDWEIEFFFEDGADVNMDDAPTVASLVSDTPDYTESFTISAGLSSAPGFQSRGFVLPFWENSTDQGCRYYRHSDGGIFLKTGIGSPENFLAYDEFEDMTSYTAGLPDATAPNGGFGLIPEHWLHDYGGHVGDWVTGDPTWTADGVSGMGKGIIGALNWLAKQGTNSQYLLLMNLGGDGRDVSPFFLNPADASDSVGDEPINWGADDDSALFYSPQRMEQWNTVFTHANEQGIMLNCFFAETEDDNTNWLDQSHAGGAVWGDRRKLYMKNMVAMFGHQLGLKWTLFEEVPLDSTSTGGSEIDLDDLNNMAAWLKMWDFQDYDDERAIWIGHPISVHGFPNTLEGTGGFRNQYKEIRDGVTDADWWLDATSMQIHEGHDSSDGTPHSFSALTENVFSDFQTDQSPGGSTARWLVLECDEQGPPGKGLEQDTTFPVNAYASAAYRRRMILFDLFFSGAAGVDWYCGYYEIDDGEAGDEELGGGDLRIEDYATRELLLDYSENLRKFLVDSIDVNYDLFTFEPEDTLVTGEYISPDFGDAEVFYKDGVCYLVYYPALKGSSGTQDPGTILINHNGVDSKATAYWYTAAGMTLIPSETETLGQSSSSTLQPYSPAGVAAAGPDDDYVMVVIVRNV